MSWEELTTDSPRSITHLALLIFTVYISERLKNYQPLREPQCDPSCNVKVHGVVVRGWLMLLISHYPSKSPVINNLLGSPKDVDTPARF